MQELQSKSPSHLVLSLLLILFFFALSAAQHQDPRKMPEKRIAPVITRLEEFEQKMPGYLNTGKNLAVLMDYDGTLAPIADNPNKTAMPVELEIILHKIAKHPQIFMAVISGRGLKDVQSRVNIDGITYAGNHGLEIEYPDGSRHDYQLPAEIQKNYTALVKELNERVYKNGAWVEDKKVSLTFHYRDAPVELKDPLKKLASEIIEKHGFRPNQAHEAIEAKPPVNWNKGEAALYILRNKFGENWEEQLNVVFAGDDTTDEDAMRLLQGVGRSFRIAADAQIQTFADYRLPKQDLVTDLLKWIARVYVV
ncbi:probable trehalose-phosphate phosphatase 1 [Scaptodrosophila lebanonensis]|uniref:Trehalose 6-phosphate phosphatase n=1 Tax=Drosophila lebanonensis TaxID=7225 RepID=A0A6J2U8V6_DROLE|nr:probable trehalose-phosphate phosphatase 1 [Scaptodrosophila lebanonensis]